MNNVEGLLLANTSESQITGNNFTADAIDGLYICHSSGDSVSDNNFTYNSAAGQIGVRLYNCSGSTLSRNNFKISKGASIELDSSSDNILSGNSMTCPILIAYSSMRNVVSSNDIGTDGHGWISLDSAYNNTLSGNNVTDTSYDGIDIFDSSDNVVTENNVVAAENAVYLFRSVKNTFYHNNFASNETEAICENSTSIWDNGSEGNYWSDYSGTDVYSSQYQNLTGSDGTGDTPYVIDSNNSDNHPLMKSYPWDSHDLGVTYVGEVSELGIFPLKAVVGLGYVLNVSVFVMNYGRYPELFNATVYANTTVIGAVANVALTNRNSVILNFTCDTTGLPYGNYTISAYATPVPDETDTTDNNCTGGTVYIGLIPGDLNGDDIVDIYDALTAAKAFGSTPSSPHWNQAADLNRDGQVDIFDIIILAQNFGKALHA
jgi:parallel beta-helix repeat protein